MSRASSPSSFQSSNHGSHPKLQIRRKSRRYEPGRVQQKKPLMEWMRGTVPVPCSGERFEQQEQRQLAPSRLMCRR
jgi:hypothetical protein